jgi:hypothetical protein
MYNYQDAKFMNKYFTFLVTLYFIQCNILCAQTPSDFQPEKYGKWNYSSNIKVPGAEVVTFNKNLAILAEWFHKYVPMLRNPKGFDLNARAYGQWDDNYKLNNSNYSLRAEIDFEFQLFYKKGGKWVIEPPHYSFDINNTETGHSSSGKGVAWFNEAKDDPALKKEINAAAVKINRIFPVFTFVKQIAPGVDVYREAENTYFHHVIIYDPEKPSYWLPVTVKELADLYMNYYSLFRKNGLDLSLFEKLKKEVANIPPDEQNEQAFLGHESNIVFEFNGRKNGLPLMRFNPDYWDRTRPISDIQFMTFYYPQMNESQMEESYKNNGHPNYTQLLVNQLNWSEIVKLLNK